MSGGRGVGGATILCGVGEGQGVWVDAGMAVSRRVGDGVGVRLGVDVGEGLAVGVGVAVGRWLGEGRGVWVGPEGVAIATRSGWARVVATTSQAGDSWLPS
jgi:hypothetical protein